MMNLFLLVKRINKKISMDEGGTKRRKRNAINRCIKFILCFIYFLSFQKEIKSIMIYIEIEYRGSLDKKN